MSTTEGSFTSWRPRLLRLCDEIGRATRGALLGAVEAHSLDSVARPMAVGAGDITFGLDLPSEHLLTEWLHDAARSSPLSVLTEDTGWRHMGPGPGGDAVALDGFDHGGPRIAFDPVDGTRNLMSDLRSAWTVVSFAPPGTGVPRMADLSGGIVAELPDSRARIRRRLSAERGGACHVETHDLVTDERLSDGTLVADDDDRADNGYFPFFRYMADLRPAIADLEARFFERLEREENADVRSCYDDQYITSAGHLVLLAMGTYRFVVDARAFLAERRGRPTITSKPYDLAGAVICAEAAGCAMTAPHGGPLDFPIDTRTPVSYVGYANAATRARLERHWLAVGGA
jgi:fructose-1,6-bisphosphatase/inositol monophosphatase family enzyme